MYRFGRKTKLSLFADYSITYVGNQTRTTKNLPGTISDYSKVAGYMVNIQKSIAFLYTSTEQVQFEI